MSRTSDAGLVVLLSFIMALNVFILFKIYDLSVLMPCAEHEVYVWSDYPDTARCVSDTDHAQHGG